MIGKLLNDRYRILAVIGRGGMGTVYQAEDTLLERPVAVKVVSNAGLGTEGQARLLQEARATARLNHPHIVAVYDVGQIEAANGEERSYIVMELVEGQTLREATPQDLDQVVQITMAICQALAAAHQQGIIHRDLKPENVVVTTGDTVKLMDFGLARIAGKTRLTQEGTFMGTLSYLAPEVILGQEAGPGSDLYALGVVLYELSAGRHPFEADNLTAVISQHLHAPVVPPSAYNERIPLALDRLILQLLSKRPEERPLSAEAVRATLENIAEDGAVPQLTAPFSQLDRLVRGRMVGREAEFTEAAMLWQEAAAGKGQLLLISGEPGIGKTRLAKELRAYAEISGGQTLTGLCYAEERRPYGPIAQMVQASLDDGYKLDLPEPVMASLLTLSPELRLAFPEVRPNVRLDPEEEQQRLFDSIITWFSALNKAGELLLVVEDAHWADSGSLAVLRYLARRLDHRRALVVATYREVELDEALPFQETLRELNRERLAQRIKLARLDKEQTRALLATLFADAITPEFLEGIYRETEGNPFFIEEVCKTLVDNGQLVYEGGRWQRPDDIEDLTIPQGIRSAIQTRLGKLSEGEQHTLQVAALLGREFEYPMLVAASGRDEEALIGALEQAERAQLIEEVGRTTLGAGPSFSFTHALIHSTLLANLSTLRRQRLQRQVALALESHFPGRRTELAPLLGRYFAEAGEGDKAVDYLLSAGDSAREVFAYQEAIQAYEQALLFLEERGDHERTARTLMKLGLTYHNIFEFEAARKTYERGFAEWHKTAEAEALNKGPVVPAPHPFRMAAEGDPKTLDPALYSDGWSGWYIVQLFSGLLQLTAGDELVPDVAQSWEVLDGGRTYVFHLRDDVSWSDGKPVTAADYEYAWKRALRPDNDQGLAEILFDIKGARAFKEGRLADPEGVAVRAVGNHSLILELESPSSYFLQLMALPVSMPVPRHIVERFGPAWTEPENIATNGPFILKSWIRGTSISFERYKDYHGRFKGNVSQVDFKIVPGEVAVELYERDELDILYPYYQLSFQDGWHAIQRHPDDYISKPNPMTTYLAFNVREPPFDDPKVRRALVLAMDREALANRLTRGLDFPAGGGLVPVGVAGHVPGIALPYDPDLARQTLAEAGYPGGKGFSPLEGGLSLSVGGLPLISEGLTAGWKTDLGFQLSFDYLDFGEYIDDWLEQRPANMWILGWSADYPDADNFLRVAHWRRLGGWHNERYEALVQDARSIADQAQRMAMYRQAEQILVEEAPVVPTSYDRLHVLVKPWLPGLPASMINGNILKDIIIEPHEG